jgi:hypothetical protein
MTGSLCLCYCKTLLINAIESLAYPESRNPPNLSPQKIIFSYPERNAVLLSLFYQTELTLAGLICTGLLSYLNSFIGVFPVMNPRSFQNHSRVRVFTASSPASEISLRARIHAHTCKHTYTVVVFEMFLPIVLGDLVIGLENALPLCTLSVKLPCWIRHHIVTVG